MTPRKLHGIPAQVTNQVPDIQDCQTPLLKSLWALKVATLQNMNAGFITAAEISAILLRAEVNLIPLRAHRALARAGDAVARKGNGQGTQYRIVGEGARLLEEGARRQGPLTFYVTGKAPWSDRRFVIKEAVKKISGEVRIVDKYFGMESLDFLQDFDKNRSIRFLTSRPSKDLGRLQREVARFKKEFPNAEFKAYPTPHEMHDRYLLFGSEVWFVGHGIKDIGGKESFVVILQDPFAKDMRSTLRASFEERWARSPNF